MNVQKTNEKGFTIIEVVLVLAIAALIFLMVFIALPALQRGQRDTQRKDDVARAVTALQNYQSNNRNAIPTAATMTATGATGFIPRYLRVGGDTFEDPSGTPYTFKAYTATLAGTFTPGQLLFATGNVCNGETPTTTGGGPTKMAIVYHLEGSGVICVNN